MEGEASNANLGRESMIPRRAKVTRQGIERSEPPPPEGWPVDEANLFDDAEDKTPVAPAPSHSLLAHAGAPFYSRYRYALGAVGLVAVIVGAFLSGQGSSSRNMPPPSPTPTAPVQVVPGPFAGGPPTLQDTIVLGVTVSPVNAQVLIDGQPMPSNPFLTRFPRSVATHHLRAVAPGFQAKERWVTFADNVMLDISLIPEPPAVPGDSGFARAGKRRSSAAFRRPAALPPPVAQPVPPPHRATPADIPLQPESDRARRRRIEASDPYIADQ
jgi:hypothetical protein